MIIISTENAPKPAGHYSQAVVHDGTVYVSGQLPIDPATGEHIRGSIEDQTEQVLRNVSAILEAAGSSMSQVLKSTVYISNIAHWPGVNEAYTRHFGEHRPARVVVPTRDLHFGFLIEMDVIAAVASE